MDLRRTWQNIAHKSRGSS